MADADDDDFAALFAASERKPTRDRRVGTGDVVRGRVIAVGATTAFVAVGAKAEAMIDLGEFRDPATGEVQLQEGDDLEATFVDDGSRSGSIVLKRVAGRGGRVPGELEQAFAHGIAIEGLVTGENKGGYDVEIGGLRAFCPRSQIDRRRTDGAQYVGQRLRFRITKLEGGRNVVVSRRQLLEEEATKQGAVVWAELRVGAVVAGTVTSLHDFGAFVDLGGIDGLIHVSELGYGHRAHPSEVLQGGQRVVAASGCPSARSRPIRGRRRRSVSRWERTCPARCDGSSSSGRSSSSRPASTGSSTSRAWRSTAACPTHSRSSRSGTPWTSRWSSSIP